MALTYFAALKKLTFNKSILNNTKNLLLYKIPKVNVIQERDLRHNFAKFNIIMKERRKMCGPEKLRRRSDWQDWNYKSEIFAFSKRLQEDISENTLRVAFTHKSYIESEERKRSEIGISVYDVPLNLTPNTELITTGEDLANSYVKSFIRHCYPYLPEEGVIIVNDYLLSDNNLAFISSNIGTTDLILSEDFPVTASTLASTLKAVIGAIAVDNNERKAQLFIHDFVCPQLITKNILEIWDICNPLQLVDTLLTRHGRLPYESRLIFETGRNTIEPIYQIGLFSDKVFLGQGSGETLEIAEEIAAYDVLQKLFRITESEKSLPFGKEARELMLNFETKNVALSKWYNKDFENKSHVGQ